MRLGQYEWVDELVAEDVQYLAALPYTLALPLHNALVVHAGLVPGVLLADQDPVAMVGMRHLTPPPPGTRDGFTAHEGAAAGAVPWSTLWPGPEHIYFGHDAARRLQLCPHATGLDTGVLYGGSLTAAVLELGQPTTLVSVPAVAMHVVPAHLRGVSAASTQPAVAATAGPLGSPSSPVPAAGASSVRMLRLCVGLGGVAACAFGGFTLGRMLRDG